MSTNPVASDAGDDRPVSNVDVIAGQIELSVLDVVGQLEDSHPVYDGEKLALVTLCGRWEFVDVDEARDLIARGIDIDEQDVRYGDTALMWAAALNRIEIIPELIRAGAALDLQNKNGNTALQVAIKHNINIAEVLIHAGATLNLQNNDGETALQIAIKTGNVKAIELLVNATDAIDQYAQIIQALARGYLVRATEDSHLKIADKIEDSRVELDANIHQLSAQLGAEVVDRTTAIAALQSMCLGNNRGLELSYAVLADNCNKTTDAVSHRIHLLERKTSENAEEIAAFREESAAFRADRDASTELRNREAVMFKAQIANLQHQKLAALVLVLSALLIAVSVRLAIVT